MIVDGLKLEALLARRLAETTRYSPTHGGLPVTLPKSSGHDFEHLP
jgi:hypothetical protein